MAKARSFFFWFSMVIFCAAALRAEPALPLPAEADSVTPADCPAVVSPAMKWAQGDFAKDPTAIRFRGKYYLYYSYFGPEAKNADGQPVLVSAQYAGIPAPELLRFLLERSRIRPQTEVNSIEPG